MHLKQITCYDEGAFLVATMDINNLLDAIKADEAFRIKLRSASNEAELMRMISGAGYEVDLEELKAALISLREKPGRETELSDEQLEGVAGGHFWDRTWMWQASCPCHGFNG